MGTIAETSAALKEISIHPPKRLSSVPALAGTSSGLRGDGTAHRWPS